MTTDRLTWADGVYDLFEIPRGQQIEREDAVKYYDELSREEMERRRAIAIRDGGSFSIDIRIVTAKGNEKWIRLTADVEREDGRSVRIFGTKQDISKAKAVQDKLQTLQTELIHLSRQSAMGALAATLAHDLNQPLTAITNYAAGARRALANSQTADEMLQLGLAAIEENAFNARNIIRKLREVTQGSSVAKALVDPNPLIGEAAALALKASGENIFLRLQLAQDVKIEIDAVQIQQVLISLIKNAIQALEHSPRREVIVSTGFADGAFELRVEDSGHGIAPEIMATMFESFVSSREGSMGVGLAICRTIVEAHDGRLTAANRVGGAPAS